MATQPSDPPTRRPRRFKPPRIAILLTGIRTKDGNTTHRLARPFKQAGWLPIVVPTGYRALGWAGATRNLIAGIVAAFIYALRLCGCTVAVGGHSDGALIAWLSCEYQVKAAPGRLLLFALMPAIDADRPAPPAVHHTLVFHNRDDGAVGIAARLLGHPWGAKGRLGHTVDDERDRVTNVDVTHDGNSLRDHGEWFDDLATNAADLIRRLNELAA